LLDAKLSTGEQGKRWGERVQTMLKRSASLTPQQQYPVEIVCLHCHGDDAADSESYIAVDEAPVWTLGNKRSLYVEKQQNCQNCIRLNRVSGRWIPRDAAIPSISRYTLRLWQIIMDIMMSSLLHCSWIIGRHRVDNTEFARMNKPINFRD
jgi:hypothetical protein